MSVRISIDDGIKENRTEPSADVKTFAQILNNFADETTAHGVPQIITRPRVAAKLFWSCLVAIALIIFCFQALKIIQGYHTYHTNLELVSSEYVEFPAVTICNFNRIKRSQMIASRRFGSLPRYWEGIVNETFQEYTWLWASNSDWLGDYFAFDGLSKDYQVDYEGSYGDADKTETREKRNAFYSEYLWSYGFSEGLSGDFFENFGEMSDDFITETADVINLSREDLREYGHQAEDFILQCTFNKRRCDYRNFTTLQNKQYGNCFTLNLTDRQRKRRGIVTKVGLDHGLHLTLFIEQPEYVGILTEESGVRVAIHPLDIHPHPEEVGFSAATGFSTSIGIRQVELKRLAHPYGDCSDGGNKKYLNSDRYNYSIISCQKKCLLDNMADKCGCVNNIYDDYDHVSQCQRHNSTQWLCSLMAETNFSTNRVACDCPPPCHEFIYESRTTSAQWPSEDYQQHLKAKLLNESKPVANLFTDTETTRKNLVRLKVYFEELNYQLEEQVPSYTLESALGAIGGLLGLYIGFSLITVFEITVFLYELFKLVFRRVKPNGKSEDIEMENTIR